MNSQSINLRLYYRIVVLLTLLWIVTVVCVGWVVRQETNEVFDSTLQELGQRLLPLAVLQIDRSDTDHEQLQPIKHDEYLTYQVFDRHGQLRLRSHNAPEIPFDVPHEPGFYDVKGQHYFVDLTKDERYLIQVTEPSTHRDDTFFHIQKFLLMPLLLLWPLSLVVIYLSIRDARKSFAFLPDYLHQLL